MAEETAVCQKLAHDRADGAFQILLMSDYPDFDLTFLSCTTDLLVEAGETPITLHGITTINTCTALARPCRRTA